MSCRVPSRVVSLGSCKTGLAVVLWLMAIALPMEAEEVDASSYLGAASCAASTCHGGVIGRGSAWRSAWTQWSGADPHVNAGLVLQDRRSRDIVLRLLGRTEGEVGQDEVDALMRSRCISCHVTTTPDQCVSTEALDTSTLIEGVSCESCHGASAGWLDAHCGNSFSKDQRDSTGFRDNETILTRAEGCVRCHVGSRSADGLVRDMNHDMIAAGHPVLRFDPEAYLRALPPHWERKATFDADPLRDRRVGRDVTLAAVAELASERARAFLDGSDLPYPEFADYDCFACHQALSMDQYFASPRRRTSQLRASDGLPIWNTWYTANLLQWPKQKLQALSPDPENAASFVDAASELASRFRAKANEELRTPSDATNELNAAIGRCNGELDWHEAAVLFLDVDAALRNLALQDSAYEATRRSIDAEVGTLLRFQDGMQSPDRFRNVEQRAFGERLTQLLRGVMETGKAQQETETNSLQKSMGANEK